jgi:hypothetical protein
MLSGFAKLLRTIVVSVGLCLLLTSCDVVKDFVGSASAKQLASFEQFVIVQQQSLRQFQPDPDESLQVKLEAMQDSNGKFKDNIAFAIAEAKRHDMPDLQQALLFYQDEYLTLRSFETGRLGHWAMIATNPKESFMALNNPSYFNSFIQAHQHLSALTLGMEAYLRQARQEMQAKLERRSFDAELKKRVWAELDRDYQHQVRLARQWYPYFNELNLQTDIYLESIEQLRCCFTIDAATATIEYKFPEVAERIEQAQIKMQEAIQGNAFSGMDR